MHRNFDEISAANRTETWIDFKKYSENQKLAQELHISTNQLKDMQLTSKYNKGIQFLIYVIDIYSTSAFVLHFRKHIYIYIYYKY